MKATGVVRRIDELGRIVIPKEIRKTLSIKQGENLEIFVGDNETISLKKYSTLSRFTEIGKVIINTLSQMINKDVLITDTDNIIEYSGKKDILNKPINEELLKVLENRIKVIEKKKNNIIIVDKEESLSYIIEPLILNGDLIGSLIVLSDETIDKNDEILTDLASKILLNYIEL